MAYEFREHPQVPPPREADGLTQFCLLALDERHTVLSKNTALFTRLVTSPHTDATNAFFLILPDVPFPTQESKIQTVLFYDPLAQMSRCDAARS